uniref:Uncharacterized protein n=1 Tax=Oryza sativa subsp. japonica TaxID=39947 RepID=Q5VPU2_ORYSJ|nr:hypothetical protein [Oryza sativa Japonica Group]
MQTKYNNAYEDKIIANIAVVAGCSLDVGFCGGSAWSALRRKAYGSGWRQAQTSTLTLAVPAQKQTLLARAWSVTKPL